MSDTQREILEAHAKALVMHSRLCMAITCLEAVGLLGKQLNANNWLKTKEDILKSLEVFLHHSDKLSEVLEVFNTEDIVAEGTLDKGASG